jgi:bleomycin hydrolase
LIITFEPQEEKMKRYRLSVSCALVVCLLTTAGVASQEEKPEMMKNRVFEMVTTPVWTTPAKSQGYTGTCWSFSTTSLIESEAYRMTGKEFELSEIYNAYFAYIEKARRYLRLWGMANFSQGGLSHDLPYLIPKYGIVRDSDYSGLLEGQNIHNHRQLSKELKDHLQKMLDSKTTGPEEEWGEDFKQILASHIGAAPATIEYEGNSMTPQQFASEVLMFDPANYVEITSFLHLPMYEEVELLIPDNWMRYKGYYNVPLDTFTAIMENALAEGYSLVVDLDVSERTRDKELGIFYMPHDLEGKVLTAEEREAMFNDRRTTDDHLMHTTAVAVDQDGRKYFYTKDSGGTDRYPYKGFAYISENYVRGKVLAIFLHKDGVPDELCEKLGIK